MDYLGIVLRGYFDENNREHLDSYFYREYKKAEKEFFGIQVFFDGCFKVLSLWEQDFSEQIQRRKIQLHLMFDNSDNEEDKLELEKQLSNERPDGIGSLTFSINLGQLTNGRIDYNMRYSEGLIISDAILAAKEKALNELWKKTPEFYEKNYKLILLEGYFHKTNSRNLKDYFIRRFKIAQREDFYNSNGFFEELLSAADEIENDVDRQIIRKKKELFTRLYDSDKNFEAIARVVDNTMSEFKKINKPDYQVKLSFPAPIDGHEAGYISLNALNMIRSQIELAKKGTIEEISKQEFSSKVFALYVHYLFKAKYIDGTKTDMINSRKKLAGVDYSTNSIANFLRYVDYKNEKDPKTKNNLEKVIKLLGEYPNAKQIAEKELSNLTS